MHKDRKLTLRIKRGAKGQSLVEYTLIATLVILALIAALVATGPAIGDVFSSAVFAALGAEEALDSPRLGEDDFQATLAWIQNQPQVVAPGGTNVALVPTAIPDGFVPPTEPPPLPTDTEIPSPTFIPTATPEDQVWPITYYDNGGNPSAPFDAPDSSGRYRLDTDTYIGLQAWTALYFQDGESGTPLDNRNLRYDEAFYQEPGTETFIRPGRDIPRITEQWFSAQLRREIWISREDAQLTFTIENPGGGVRLYVQTPSGTCADFQPGSNSRGATTTSGCMIIDEWVDAPQAILSGTYEFPFDGVDPGPGVTDLNSPTYFTGPYVLYLEYYQKTGAPNLTLSIDSAKASPDDTGLAGQTTSCNWGPYEGDRSNERPYAWNAAVGLEGDNIPNNQRCYLELRGFVDMAPGEELANYEGETYGTATVPTFTFWHIWDLNPNTRVWLEVAEYNDVDGDDNPVNRPTAWTRVWPPNDLNNQRNYEWTQEEIELTGYNVGDNLAYRFVIENNGGGGGRKRWFVDDIRIGSKNLPDLTVQNPGAADTFTVCNNTDPTAGPVCESYWNMEDTAKVLRDFRTTGRWDFTPTGAHVGTGLGDDPGRRYSLEPGADLNSVPTDRRIYYVEFDKRVDVSNTSADGIIFDSDPNGIAAAPPDEDGDDGAPLLSFWHSYNLRDYVSLQVQYYDDAAGEWRLLREVVSTRAASEASASSTFVQVPLNEREVADENGYGTGVFDTADTDIDGDGSFWTEWYQGPLRMRFAMIVDENAINDALDGWTLDDIEIERLGNFTYTAYPFADSAGDAIIAYDTANNSEITFTGFDESLDRWLRTGTWAISNERSYTGTNVFSDSPNSDYIAGSNSVLELRAPIDLNSDTFDNPLALGCDPVQSAIPVTCADPTQRHSAAVNPVLSFWWNRDMDVGSRFTVEIRPNGGQDAPITVWEYNYSSDNGEQPAWERVEIALNPFVLDDPDPLLVYDDDIVVVFRLDARGNSSARGNGVFVDDIVLQEDIVPRGFRLWSGDTDGVSGDGSRYIDTIDDRSSISNDDNILEDERGNWWNRWYRGGEWYSDFYTYTYLAQGAQERTDLMARSGTQLFHDSPPTSEDPLDNDASTTYTYMRRSYNVLEMIRPIDMTGLETVQRQGDPEGIDTGDDNGSPLLYWWQRMDRGDDSRLLVQVAVQDDNPPADRIGNPLTYGNDELHGWSQWLTVYITNDNPDADYAWVRKGVNLANAPIYNNSGNRIDTRDFVGEVIRVRFVLDGTDVTNTDDLRDGWFIDDVEFTTRIPRIIDVPLVDSGDSMLNWMPEGTWGLDVAKFRGGNEVQLPGGGTWNVRYLNCNYRPFVETNQQANGSRGGCDGAAISNTMLTRADYRAAYGNFNAGNRWYIEDNISTLAFDVAFGDDARGGPPNAPAGFNWSDDFAAEFRRTITVTEAQRYQFYTRADDGVRVGITPFPQIDQATADLFGLTVGENIPTGTGNYADGSVAGGRVFYNNIIDDWNNGSARVNQGSVTLIPGDYLLTVQYYEDGGEAEVAFGISNANASFSDSPLSVPPPNIDSFATVPVNYLSDSSMELDGLLDLRPTNKPIIQYYTQYDLNNVNGTAYLEVSRDGGFEWTRDNLEQTVVAPDLTVQANSPTSWNGREVDEWEQRTNSLEAYAGQMISLRFRVRVDANLNRVRNEATDNDDNTADGVYITDILIQDLQPSTPNPIILRNPQLTVNVSVGVPQPLDVFAGGAAPLRYEWFLGTPPVGDPGTPGVTPPGNVAVGTNSNTFTPPADLVPGLYTYWVRVSNAISDNDPNIFPAVSVPTEYRVSDCAPVALGDCGIYRINVNGDDLSSRDGTQPGWFGDRDSATQFAPGGTNFSGNSFNGNDNGVAIPNVSGNEFVIAAISGAAPEQAYERFRAAGSGNSMAWTFPVEAGQYTVRLYMTDPYSSNNQGRFSVRLNGDVANYKTGGTSQPLNNVDFFDIIGGVNQQAAVLEMDAVSVTPAQNALTVEVSNGSDTTYVSAIEIFPVTSLNPEIVQQPPTTATVADGATAQVGVSATGANLSFQWYEVSGPSDFSTANPISAGVATSVQGLNGTSVLSIPNFTGADRFFWAQVTGGPDGNSNQTVNSVVARITACTFDAATSDPGTCGFWFIDLHGDNIEQANDGTRWFPDSTTPGITISDPSATRTNNLNNFTYSGNVSEDHVPRDVFERHYSRRARFGWSIDMSQPAGAGGGNGFYDVTIYSADNTNRSDRRSMTIYIEGVEVITNYHPENDPFCGDDNRFCSITFNDIQVTDGVLDIEFESTQTQSTRRQVRVNAIEVTPR